MISGIFDCYKRMKENNILFSFQGEITTELVISILQIMELNMEISNEEIKVKRKVYYVLVECLQNLFHHHETIVNQHEPDKQKLSAIFLISKQENDYLIMTGNYIKKNNITPLQEKLTQINTLSKTELKEQYMSILEKGEMSSKGGGGLGLIEIARKSGDKFVFDFTSIDEEYSFFELTIKIKSEIEKTLSPVLEN